MKILVANIGSTSLKYRLYEFAGAEERLLARGGFERVSDYAATIDSCMAALVSGGWISRAQDLAAVGFKTVMAEGIQACVRLDDDALRAMEAYNPIAPAHNPPYIMGIRQFARQMPTVPLIGLFETAFYQWAPEAAQRYAVPKTWYEAGVRRWGFHGASHKFIAERSAELLGRPDIAERTRNLYSGKAPAPTSGDDLRVISCHLGGSSSISGLRNGVAIGNSLGMSPQSGLPHNNRVGELDSYALPFVIKRLGCSLEEAERVLREESGLKGLSGGLNDLRDIQEKARQGDGDARLALDVLAQQARHWIGAYYWELNGADALVFTAGIGENQDGVRKAICEGVDRLGVKMDWEANAKAKGEERLISLPESAVKVFVIPTNEELVVAREAKRFLENE